MAVQHNIKETINDNLILRHELAYILQVMRTRLNENLFDKQPQPASPATLINLYLKANWW